MPNIAKEVTPEMAKVMTAEREERELKKLEREQRRIEKKQLANNKPIVDLSALKDISSRAEFEAVSQRLIDDREAKDKKPTLKELSSMFKEVNGLKRSIFGDRVFLGLKNKPLEPITDAGQQTALGDFEERNGFRLKDSELKYILKNNEVDFFNPFKYFLEENTERKPDMLKRFITAMNIQPQFIGEDNDFNVSTEQEEMMVYKWLTGIYNSAMKGHKNDLILALYGPKQGEGKTTLINALMKHDRLNCLFGSATIEDTDNFKRQACYNLLILDDENKSGKKADIEGIKKLSGAESFQIVDKFEIHPKPLKRNASFCICTNEKNILKDPTGNRRFLPIEVAKMDIAFIKNEFCVYSFWQDVKDLAEKESWVSYLTTEDVDGLQDYFGRFFETSTEGELVESHCEPCDAKYGMNTAELIRALDLKNFIVNNTKGFTQALRLKGYDYKNTRHIDGKQRKVWNCNIL